MNVTRLTMKEKKLPPDQFLFQVARGGFTKNFAFQKTYQIVVDVPITLVNTSPPISAADTQV